MNIFSIEGKDYIKPSDFAKMCNVTRATIYNWIRFNGMPSVESSDRFHFLIPLEAALKWVEKYKS